MSKWDVAKKIGVGLGKAALSSMESDARRMSRNTNYTDEQRESLSQAADLFNDWKNGNIMGHGNWDDDEY